MTALTAATAQSDATGLTVSWTLSEALPASGTVVLTAAFGDNVVGAKFLNGNRIAQYLTTGGTQVAVPGDVQVAGSTVTAVFPAAKVDSVNVADKSTATATAAGQESSAPIA